MSFILKDKGAGSPGKADASGNATTCQRQFRDRYAAVLRSRQHGEDERSRSHQSQDQTSHICTPHCSKLRYVSSELQISSQMAHDLRWWMLALSADDAK